MPNESYEFNGDFDAATFHVGYVLNNEIVGVLTVMKTAETVWQFRGMAVSESMQRKNIGKQLIEYAGQVLKNENASEIWLNAREIAIPFYEKCGFTTVGVFFDITPIGRHKKMIKK